MEYYYHQGQEGYHNPPVRPERAGSRGVRERRRKRRAGRRSRRRIFLVLFLFILLGTIGNHVFGGIFSKAIAHSSLGSFLTKKENTLTGKGIPESLVKLAKNNPEAFSFVESYPENHAKDFVIDLSHDLAGGKRIPLFIQWDERWGYREYGGDYFALNGCGPTCLSMVYCGLTGDTEWNPYRVAKLSEERGYYVEGEGTSWELMRGGAEEIGLKESEMVFERSHILQTLTEGKPIICAMRKGDFTSAGHFIVLTGVSEDGRIFVNDPNSRKRSEKLWELDRLMEQMKNLWCYEVRE